jgi:hypothetical protein
MKQAIDVCSESSFVTVLLPVDPSNDWYDYHSMWLVTLYTQMAKYKPKPLKIRANHIFIVLKEREQKSFYLQE